MWMQGLLVFMKAYVSGPRGIGKGRASVFLCAPPLQNALTAARPRRHLPESRNPLPACMDKPCRKRYKNFYSTSVSATICLREDVCRVIYIVY